MDELDAERRARFVSYFEGPPLRGDRAALIRKTGYSKGRVNHFLDTQQAFGQKAAANLAHRLGLPNDAFERSNWTAEQHAAEGVVVLSVAHDLSHQTQSHTLLEITWESLVAAVPDSLFVLPLRDDALAPDHPAGRRVVWRKDRPLKTGRLVLLRDKHGQDHARVLHASGEPGQWIAAAGKAYTQFAVPSPEVTVLAVHQGFLEDD